ncbi:hypothetical protein BTVI_56422 [Pitangus sulphuratus]|nr:hypothetical protein BTVI_56422 [Pitangus sulphuratus]
MKFAEHLAAHITPEWRKQYIQYEALKEMLYAAVDQAPSIEVSAWSIYQSTSSIDHVVAIAVNPDEADVHPLAFLQGGIQPWKVPDLGLDLPKHKSN